MRSRLAAPVIPGQRRRLDRLAVFNQRQCARLPGRQRRGQLTYTVQVDDGNGGIKTQDVTITVHGTEDAPVIEVIGSDSAAATLTESYKTLSKTGTLTVTDADISDVVTAAVVTGVTLGGTTGGLTSAAVQGMLTVTAGSIAADPTDTHNLAWAFNSNPQTFNFLDAGESLTLTYTVQVTTVRRHCQPDGNGHHRRRQSARPHHQPSRAWTAMAMSASIRPASRRVGWQRRCNQRRALTSGRSWHRGSGSSRPTWGTVSYNSSVSLIQIETYEGNSFA